MAAILLWLSVYSIGAAPEHLVRPLAANLGTLQPQPDKCPEMRAHERTVHKEYVPVLRLLLSPLPQHDLPRLPAPAIPLPRSPATMPSVPGNPWLFPFAEPYGSSAK